VIKKRLTIRKRRDNRAPHPQGPAGRDGFGHVQRCFPRRHCGPRLQRQHAPAQRRRLDRPRSHRLLVPIGFSFNFFGTAYTQLYGNNNGNVTFDAALGTYTPFPLLATSRVIIPPFFADVDTRGTGNGSQPGTYGTGTFSGRTAFGVNWVDVRYFSRRTDKLNSFRRILVYRSDIAVGNADIIFNYDRIQWETGRASGGTNGLGRNSARAGFSKGSTVSF